MELYDVVVIGGGPGGYTAAIYAARAGLETLVLDREYPLGQMKLTTEIDNYPGFPEGIDGYTLCKKMQEGAERFSAQTVQQQAISLSISGNPKQVQTEQGVYFGKTVIFAPGSEPRKLGLADEERLLGKGVHYCAVCDGAFYKGKTVAVVGGGNAAVEDALELAGIAKKVILIHRREKLRADRFSQEKLFSKENVELRLNQVMDSLEGEQRLTGLTLRNALNGGAEKLACDALFVSIGRIPQTQLVEGQIALTADGYIPADETTLTKVPGFFAVGDVRTKPLRQIVTATADGAVAASMCLRYLSGA